MLYHSKVFLRNKSLILFSLFLGLGVGLHLIEFLIPKPFPWLKIGLHNVLLLLIILNGTFNQALLFSIFRPILSSFFTGTFLSPIFFISFFASIISFFAIYLSYKFLRNIFSVVSISIIGAVIHNITQIYYVYIFWINEKSVLKLIPLLILFGIITGLITGILTKTLNKKYSNDF